MKEQEFPDSFIFVCIKPPFSLIKLIKDVQKGESMMRFSELGGKEIVDLNNGARMGTAGQTDLVIDTETGKIHSMLLPGSSFFGFNKKKEGMTIPWNTIRTIGSEMIIIDIKMSNSIPEQE